ncbi:MAG: glycosyltransferase [Eubacteriales bacterium]|jgi:glycosyltransferase involved in cell wall biosynthesis
MLPLKTQVPLFNWLSQQWIHPFINQALTSLNMVKPVLLTFIPHIYAILGKYNEVLVCYYCVDDMGTLSKLVNPRVVAGYERYLIDKADLVFTTSKALQQRFSQGHKRVYLFPNGTDPCLYACALAPETIIPSVFTNFPHPVLGFSGVVDFRLDQKLIENVARHRPKWSFVFVGYVRTSVKMLERLPNVHFVPNQPLSALPAYFKAFDVGLIPYSLVPMSMSIYPTKLNEYLAAGLPVVTSMLPELVDCPDEIVCRISSPEEFILAVERLWPTRKDSTQITARIAYASKNSWAHRAAGIADLIDSCLLDVHSGSRDVAL